MNAKQLTDEQKEQFVEAFKEVAGHSINDWDSPCPWGSPWLHGTPVELEGDTIDEMAENYYYQLGAEILFTSED